MHGCLGIDVIEGQNLIVLVDLFGRHLPCHNAAKETIHTCYTCLSENLGREGCGRSPSPLFY